MVSKFEAHHTTTEELTSTTTKMWDVQFVATALILALRNADWSKLNLPTDVPIFTGKYNDFNVDWYSAVGS